MYTERRRVSIVYLKYDEAVTAENRLSRILMCDFYYTCMMGEHVLRLYLGACEAQASS